MQAVVCCELELLEAELDVDAMQAVHVASNLREVMQMRSPATTTEARSHATGRCVCSKKGGPDIESARIGLNVF